MSGGFREVLTELHERRGVLEGEIEKLDAAIAAIATLAPSAELRKARAERGKPRRRKVRNVGRPRGTRKGKPRASGKRRFIVVCKEHKAPVEREADADGERHYRCTVGGHEPEEGVIKDLESGELYGPYATPRAFRGAARRNG
jgi:hypothetical protein